jgi:hypothetical protein
MVLQDVGILKIGKTAKRFFFYIHRVFFKMDIFKMSILKKYLTNVVKKRFCGFADFFLP